MKWRGGLKNIYPESFNKLEEMLKKNNSKYIEVSHHTAHAANAFFSSNFEESIILSIDGGGEETENGIDKTHESSFCIFYGYKNKIYKILDLGTSINIGNSWSKITKEVFKLSSGPPIGNQCGTVMAMAAVGKNFEKYNDDMIDYIKKQKENKFEEWSKLDENEKFNLAASLQYCTEKIVIEIIESTFNKLINSKNIKNVCVVGGVALNGLLNNKILNHFKQIENIYIPPVPYDAGLAIGCCQYLYFHEYNNERTIEDKNESPYLGVEYKEQEILSSIKNNSFKIEITDDEKVINLLTEQKVISIFNEKSESGRRALGNRSIFADPRNEKMKEILNTKIKHRQWYRP
ncbi:MAG: carbamoyltransferase N-terminal domain-containing protein, partial [Candidatus Fonsibacter ubiquis]